MYSEDPGIDGRIILKWIFRKWNVGGYGLDRAKDRDRWRAVVNAVMNIRGVIKCGGFLISCKTS